VTLFDLMKTFYLMKLLRDDTKAPGGADDITAKNTGTKQIIKNFVFIILRNRNDSIECKNFKND